MGRSDCKRFTGVPALSMTALQPAPLRGNRPGAGDRPGCLPVFSCLPRPGRFAVRRMRFHKYHALGNDYIVLNPADFPEWKSAPSVAQIRVVCHRNFGVGSDGILWGPLPSRTSEHGLRIFTPDGSEAEKSGNGIRIFCRHLLETKRVQQGEEFRLHTLGGVVRCTVFEGGDRIRVEMGHVSFRAPVIPHVGPDREVLGEEITGISAFT